MAYSKAFSIDTIMEIEFLDFSIDNFRKGLFDYGNRLIRRAGRAFVQEIYNNVPVWSGMALASIKPLARAVRFALLITPREDAPNRINLGESLGGKVPLRVLQASGTADMEFEFNWRTLVEHFNIHEQRNMPPLKDPRAGYTMTGKRVRPAWKAIEKAQAAAEAVLIEGVNNAPQATDYIIKKRIVFDPKMGQLSL